MWGRIPQITVKELAVEIASDAPPVVLDIREPAELSISRLAQVLHIPMDDLSSRLAEIPQDRPVVVICRSGSRSSHVTRFLAKQGFTDVRNVAGGMNAWAREVDPSMPQY